MNWQDEGIVLNIKAHGENAMLATCFTKNQGLMRGFVHGGNSKTKRPLWQPGNVLRMEWRARLSEQLGTLTGELEIPYAASFVGAPKALPYLQSFTGLLAATLPEAHPYPNLYNSTIALLNNLTKQDCAAHYARYELQLLAELGFALDLSCCTATGQTHDLIYVSPRTGRAVSRDAAKGYEDRLLALPEFLLKPLSPVKQGERKLQLSDSATAMGERANHNSANVDTPSPNLSPSHFVPGERNCFYGTSKQISDALFLTGFFLERWIFHSATHPALKSRQRLLLNTPSIAA